MHQTLTQSLFTSDDAPIGTSAELGQFFTPPWAAEMLLRQYFGDLSEGDVVLEPMAGTGAWLRALESLNDRIPALGVEIDPAVAAIARQHTKHPIITGDFFAVPLDIRPTVAIGNPNFVSRAIDALLAKIHALLPDDGKGRCGFILPAHYFSLPERVLTLQKNWSFKADHIPRYLYPRISFALTFAVFMKDYRRRLIGFSLYTELEALKSLRPEFERIASTSHKPWAREMARLALEQLGGTAPLERIYAHVERLGVPTKNPFWRDRLRETLGRHYHRVAEGVFSLSPVAA